MFKVEQDFISSLFIKYSDKLEERIRSAVMYRYGLDGQGYRVYWQVGELVGHSKDRTRPLSVERARQLVNRGVGLLRKFERAPRGHFAVLPADQTSIADAFYLCRVRVTNALSNLGAKTVADLAKLTRVDFLYLKNFGQASMREVDTVMAKYGIQFAPGEFRSLPPLEQSLQDTPGLGFHGRYLKRIGILTVGDLVAASKAKITESNVITDFELSYLDRWMFERGLKFVDEVG